MRRTRYAPAALAAVAGVVLAAALVGAAAPGPASSDRARLHTPGADATVAQTTGNERPGFTESVTGTSQAVLACGHQPGPTAISFPSQEPTDATVQIRAVDLAEGGFVAVHERSFVDGAWTTSVVGTTGYLDAGLHQNLTVPVDIPGGRPTTAVLVAVAYRDDGDRVYEFVSTDGASDRPYTVTYTETGGNVTNEAGEVVGDLATVTFVPPTQGAAASSGDTGANVPVVEAADQPGPTATVTPKSTPTATATPTPAPTPDSTTGAGPGLGLVGTLAALLAGAALLARRR